MSTPPRTAVVKNVYLDRETHGDVFGELVEPCRLLVGERDARLGVMGRLKTGHLWALQNRQVNGLVNMSELLFLPA